ncbi:hypothetical protein D3C72_502100 [compost metagenome]
MEILGDRIRRGRHDQGAFLIRAPLDELQIRVVVLLGLAAGAVEARLGFEHLAFGLVDAGQGELDGGLVVAEAVALHVAVNRHEQLLGLLELTEL